MLSYQSTLRSKHPNPYPNSRDREETGICQKMQKPVRITSLPTGRAGERELRWEKVHRTHLRLNPPTPLLLRAWVLAWHKNFRTSSRNLSTRTHAEFCPSSSRISTFSFLENFIEVVQKLTLRCLTVKYLSHKTARNKPT